MSRRTSLALITAAAIAAIALWCWWVGFDNPQIIPRPHVAAWDTLSLSLGLNGVDVAPGAAATAHSPLIWAAGALQSVLGHSWGTLCAVQILLLILLVLASAVLAWQLGGPGAGAAAAWAAALAPASVGCAVNLDDLLCIQALITLSLALIALAGRARLWWLGLLSALPMLLLLRCSLVFSNAVLALASFCCGASALIWLLHTRAKDPQSSGKRGAIAALIGAACALLLGPVLIPGLQIHYLFGQAQGEQYPGLLENPLGALAPAVVWAWFQVGLPIALVAVVSAAALLAKRQWRTALVALAWLGVPLLLLSLMTKRRDNYLISMLPATYVLVGLGIGLLGRRAQFAGLAALIAAAGGLWAWQVSPQGQGAASINPWDGLEDPSVQYLLDPRANSDNYSTVARQLAQESSARGLRLLFVRIDLADGLYALHAWRAHPDVLPLDLIRGPDWDAAPGVAIWTGDQYADSLALALGQFTVEATARDALIDQAALGRLLRLSAAADDYNPLTSAGGWTLFVPEDK
ncbi:MAG: hypothetical protein P9M14_04315 [Candidatus Alcyoniella australis]|nr:hypothetical protein [Candidatus Alcyoniella australis]